MRAFLCGALLALACWRCYQLTAAGRIGLCDAFGTESPYQSGSGGNSGGSYPLRLGLARERQTPQWFTAAPLLSQFYAQPSTPLLPAAVSPSYSHQQHAPQHEQRQQHDHDNPHEPHHHNQTDTPLRGRGYENYRFPSDALTNSSISHHRQQQQLRVRRLSHFELRGDEPSPLLAAISAQEATAPSSSPQTLTSSDDQQQQQHYQQPPETTAPPVKKRKKTAFRLRNFLCMHPGCGKSFTDNAHLRDHTFVHTGEKSLSCELCGKSFARLSTLHDHQRVHSGERPYCCSQPGCEKRYSSRAALRFHIASHAATRRSIVDPDRPSAIAPSAVSLPPASDSLMLHRSSAHETRRSPILQPITQPQHRSGVTSPPPLPPIANDTLYLHAKIQTQQTQIAELQSELQKLKRKAKKRPSSSSASASSSSVSRAQTAAAPPMVAPVLFLMDGMKPFQCFVCYQRFANFFQLSFHAKLHPEATLADVTRTQEPIPVGPKYCPEEDCEYAEKNRKPLKNLQTLKRHWQRRHQLAWPYVCALCPSADPKTFKTKENLKAHEKDCKGGGAGAGGVRSEARQEHLLEVS